MPKQHPNDTHEVYLELAACRQALRDTCPCLVHEFHPERGAALGPQVVINQVLDLEVPFAEPAGVVLTQQAPTLAAACAPAWRSWTFHRHP